MTVARLSPNARAPHGGPVRVCYLIDELARAGTETQLLALIRSLDRSKVRPYLCLLRGDNPMSQALEPDDCPVWRLGVGALRSPRTLVTLLRFARFLRRERIDVLQAYFADSGYFGISAAWLAGVPHRLRTRNNLGHWLTPTHRFLGRRLNVLTTGTLANCAAARDRLLLDERPAPASVLVLENGVDPERFDGVPSVRLRQPDDPCRVGAVANLRAVKGLYLLVRAAALLSARFPQASFHVVGEGEARPALEKQIAEAGLGGRFVLHGSCDDVPAFLASLDVAVLCSRAEGLPNAVLEYMAAGRPIVATCVGATPELIEDGVHGLLVPPEDAGRLAAALDRLLGDAEFAQDLGASARRRVRERYSRQAMVRRFEAFYLSLRRR